MNNKKTVAERLRKASKSGKCEWLSLYRAVTGEMFDCRKAKCDHCFRFVCRELANVIEAEQAEMHERYNSSFDSFRKDIDRLNERIDCIKWSQLPEGVQWPRFEDGELVKFGDEYASGDTIVTVGGFIFDRSGFSIYASSSGTGECEYGEPVKRRKHDTWEQLRSDVEDFVNSIGDGRNATYVFALLERQRKLMGGE